MLQQCLIAGARQTNNFGSMKKNCDLEREMSAKDINLRNICTMLRQSVGNAESLLLALAAMPLPIVVVHCFDNCSTSVEQLPPFSAMLLTVLNCLLVDSINESEFD